jgi:hypothetical protein
MYCRPRRKPKRPCAKFLDVAVHQVERVLLEARDEADAVAGGDGVGRLAAGLRRRQVRVDAEVRVEPEHHDHPVVRLARVVAALQIVEREAQGLREPAALDDEVTPRARDLVGLEGGVALDLELGGRRPARRERAGHEEGRRRATEDRAPPRPSTVEPRAAPHPGLLRSPAHARYDRRARPSVSTRLALGEPFD